MVMMEQIRVIDEKRIVKYIGKLSPRYMKIQDKRIMISFVLVRYHKKYKKKGST